MGYFDWVDSRIKKYHWTDIGLIKLSVAGFVLMIAKVWDPLLSLNWYLYGLVSILAAVKPVFVLFKK
jgi:hypothetical protein